MNDTPATTTEKTVVTHASHTRLWICTIASLSLNGLILLLILIGIIAHHHQTKMHGGFGGGGRGGDGGCACGEGFRHHHHGFHHHHFRDFGGGDMDRGEGHHFGGMGPGGMDKGGMDRGEHGPGGLGGMRGGDEERGMGHHHHDGMSMGGGMGGFRTPPDPAKMSEGIMAHLTQQLTLTDDQKAKIKPIIDAQVADLQKQMQDEHQAMQKNFEDTKAKLKPILNADQQKLLDAVPMPGEKPGDKAADKPDATT
jgi:hypothetical protein